MVIATAASSYATPEAGLYPADVAKTELVGLEASRTKLSERLRKAREEDTHTVVTRHGQPLGVLVDMEWYRRARTALKEPTDL